MNHSKLCNVTLGVYGRCTCDAGRAPAPPQAPVADPMRPHRPEGNDDEYARAVYWPLMRGGYLKEHLCANGEAFAALRAALSDAARPAPTQEGLMAQLDRASADMRAIRAILYPKDKE